MLADVQIYLASRVAERLILGQASNGHSGDGPAATNVAASMVTRGHGRYIGSLYRDDVGFTAAVEDILAEAINEVEGLLMEKKPHIEAVAKLLQEKGEVRGAEIHKLLDEMDAA
jgi:ATP-dependent Zn protease